MKKILILTVFLAILTIGAVSAADSEINNATCDEVLSAPEADEAIYESEDDVLSAPDDVVDEDVLSAADGDILGTNPIQKDTQIYDTINLDEKYEYLVKFGWLKGVNYNYGNFTIKIEGEEYYNGKISPFRTIYISDLNKIPDFGNYTVEYSYSDANGNSFNVTKSVEFTYTFYVYVMGADPETRYVHVGFALPIDASGNVSIWINNKTYKNVNLKPILDTHRMTLFDIEDFVLGFNNISAYYSGDSIYPSREIHDEYSTHYFHLYPTLTYPDIIFDGEDAYISITVPKNEKGVFVLSMDKNNASYYYDAEFEEVSRIDVVDGAATIKIPKFYGEKYFKWDFVKGDNWYCDGYHWNATFNILSTNMSTQIKAIATTEVKEGQSVQLRLLNEGDPVYIYILIDGQFNMVRLSGQQMDFIIPDLSVGDHTVIVQSIDRYSPVLYLKKFNITVKENTNVNGNGGSTPKPIDNTVDASLNNTGNSPNSNANSNGNNQVSNKISLSLKTVKVKKSAKKVILKAILKINGKVAKSKTVTFKFNGKSYKVKTNSKGVAKLTVKKSVLKKLKVGKKIKYQVGYSKKLVKKTATVKK